MIKHTISLSDEFKQDLIKAIETDNVVVSEHWGKMNIDYLAREVRGIILTENHGHVSFVFESNEILEKHRRK